MHQRPLLRTSNWTLTSSCLVLFLSLLGCSSPKTSSPPPQAATKAPLPKAAPSQASFGSLETLAPLDWRSSYGVYLIGVDPSSGRALLRYESKQDVPLFALEMLPFDASKGAAKERWSASKKQAALLVSQYPSFRALSSPVALSKERQKYASWLRQVGPWYTRITPPPLGVVPAPDGQAFLYNRPPDGGRDGDWLMIQELDKPPRRFDLGVRASYLPSFSPDSSWVAWNGGQKQFATPGRQVGYRLHLRQAQQASSSVSVVSSVQNLQQPPLWLPDSKAFVTVSKPSPNSWCITRVLVDSTSQQLLCSPVRLSASLSPEGKHLAVVEHGGKDSLLLMFDPWAKEGGRELWSRSMIHGVRAMHWDARDRLLVWFNAPLADKPLDRKSWAHLHLIDPQEGSESLKTAAIAPAESLLGLSGARVVGDKLIVLQQRQNRVKIVGVDLVD